ncbi:tetratricopeptide repeat protein [Amycolatopsis sp. WGS_07]|uniref:tetratricopeptide repeat protein n=1 Tax=Amycolatopsis sp. WGS_07 TaxID=3076764 RepID=UPI003872F235
MAIVSSVVSAITQAAALAFVLLLLSGILHASSRVWHQVRSRGVYPVIVHQMNELLDDQEVRKASDNSTDAAPEDENELPRKRLGRTIGATLTAYIAEDVQGIWAVTPGLPNVSTPTIPAETPKSADGWISALFELASSPRPAYHIMTTQLAASSGFRVAVQVSKTPGNSILAARTFACSSIDDLVFEIGGFCVECIQREPRIMRRTPRWIQWNKRSGYATFRRALSKEQIGRADDALELYQDACSKSLGNLTLTLRKASLLEQRREYLSSVHIYRRSHELWPEHIETLYRYAATIANNRIGNIDVAEIHDLLVRKLRRRSIALHWAKTWLPNNRNLGERTYWRSWFRPAMGGCPGFFHGRSKRADYLYAVRVLRQTLIILRVLDGEMSNFSHARPCDTDAQEAFRQVHKILERRRIGWLARYAGACFYSICMQHHDQLIPNVIRSPESFGQLGDRALIQLSMIVRDPHNNLDPAWMSVDPDMAGLRGYYRAKEWAEFFGLNIDCG